MFTFLIISNVKDISTCVYQAFSTIGTPEKGPEGIFIVESTGGMKNGWIAFHPIDDIQYDYEVNELEGIKTEIKNPKFFLIEGRNGEINFSNKFILALNPTGKVLIDNDHGIIADLADIKKKIKSGEDWLYLSP